MFIKRLEVLIRDGPIGKRASVGHAILARHSKVVGVKSPRLRAVNSRSAAEARSIVVVIEFVRLNDSRPAVRIDKYTRVTNYVRTSVMTVDSEPLITELVATDISES